jgi:hypothetical protein
MAGASPAVTMRARHAMLGDYELTCAGDPELLFSENETNDRRLYGTDAASPYVKDAFHTYVVGGDRDAVNPARTGTKAAAHYRFDIPAGATVTVDLRLRHVDPAATPSSDPLVGLDTLRSTRRNEADEFYAAVLPAGIDDDARLVARQAFAGMLWSKQFYHYVIEHWLDGDPAMPPPPPERFHGRNARWRHLHNADVISMPDTWEFPWYASWDLGFHCSTLAYIDPQFAKDQVVLLLREWYMEPDGRLPAYEWNFDDVNPPVLALAAAQIFMHEAIREGEGDLAFLERVFHKFLLDFTWWVNREDADGNDVFEGGFLGLDNIGPFDRSMPLPPGYSLGQADGTAWMATFAQTMQAIALLLARPNPVYEDLGVKFFEHFLDIAKALNLGGGGGAGLWDEDEGFYYDVLQKPDGSVEPVRAHTVIGFVPLFGTFTYPAAALAEFPVYEARRQWYLEHRPELVAAAGPIDTVGWEGQAVRSVVPLARLQRLAERMLDEAEFLSPHGIRAVSRFHADHPYSITFADSQHTLDYEPGESTNNLFGGNSNWRGPIWMPVNFLLIKALDNWHSFLGPKWQIECPTGSGRLLDLGQVAVELARRNASIFLRGADGRRPVWGDVELFQTDPYWRDLIPFHEYFHGDTGRGCGAAHQTGWTGLVATLIADYGPRFAG